MNAVYKPKALELWQRLPNYRGVDWSTYYAVLGQTRDSDHLECSNFECAHALLRDIAVKCHQSTPGWGGLDVDGAYTDTMLRVSRFNHRRCGWVETLLVHKDSAVELIEAADAILCSLQACPVLDERDLLKRKLDAMTDDFDKWTWDDHYSDVLKLPADGAIDGTDFEHFLKTTDAEAYKGWREHALEHWTDDCDGVAPATFDNWAYTPPNYVTEAANDWLTDRVNQAALDTLARGLVPEWTRLSWGDQQVLLTLLDDALGCKALHVQPLTVAERISICFQAATSEPWRLLDRYLKDFETDMNLELTT